MVDFGPKIFNPNIKPWVEKASPSPSDCVYGYIGCRFKWVDLHGFESFKSCKYKKTRQLKRKPINITYFNYNKLK
jgi:hypothetical protein